MNFEPGNAQHIGDRGQQQDSFAFSDPGDNGFARHGGLLAVVADGMGGLTNGQTASRTAVKAFLSAYRAKAPTESICDALSRSLTSANSAVQGTAAESQGEVGTTLTAVVAHNDRAWWISSGDSRLYLIRDGITVQATADHTHGNDLLRNVAAGEMDRDSALTDPERAHLTSYLGSSTELRIDLSVRGLPLRDSDVLMLCSDGVYRAVSADEMAVAFQSRTANAACEALERAVIARAEGRQDNLTVAAIRCRAVSRRVGLPALAHASRAMLTVLLLQAVLLLALGGLLIRKSFLSRQPENQVAPVAQNAPR